MRNAARQTKILRKAFPEFDLNKSSFVNENINSSKVISIYSGWRLKSSDCVTDRSAITVSHWHQCRKLNRNLYKGTKFFNHLSRVLRTENQALC